MDHYNYYEVLEHESDDDNDLSNAETDNDKSEIANISTGISQGYKHSNELKPLNYKQAMKSDDKKE